MRTVLPYFYLLFTAFESLFFLIGPHLHHPLNGQPTSPPTVFAPLATPPMPLLATNRTTIRSYSHVTAVSLVGVNHVEGAVVFASDNNIDVAV